MAKGQFVGLDVARTTLEDLRQLIRDDYEKNGRDVKHLDTVLNPLTKARSGRPLKN